MYVLHRLHTKVAKKCKNPDDLPVYDKLEKAEKKTYGEVCKKHLAALEAWHETNSAYANVESIDSSYICILLFFH